MKTMTKLRAISTLLATCALSTLAAMPPAPDSELKDWPADPASNVVKIKRVITKADDAKWITAAENLPADATALRAAALKQNENAVVAEKQWWYLESINTKNLIADSEALRAALLKESPHISVSERKWAMESINVKVPFALTGDAVTYYSELITSYGMQVMNRITKPDSRFSYNASVSQHVEFTLDEKVLQNVTVVTMSMYFFQSSAVTPDEAMTIAKVRTVVFDQEGKALHISGDGETKPNIEPLNECGS